LTDASVGKMSHLQSDYLSLGGARALVKSGGSQLELITVPYSREAALCDTRSPLMRIGAR
jgi:hypothetical protein